MKRLSASVLWLQALLFALGTVYVIWGFNRVAGAGGGLVPGFESIELRRLVAALAPYLVLPVSIVFSLLLHSNARYGIAASVPLVLVASAAVAGRLFLAAVPDPIMENFGARPQPYAGFLVLPPQSLPAGFQEVSHHYTKQEYSVGLVKTLNGERITLDVIESPITQFVHNSSRPIRQFEHQGITGWIYSSDNAKSGETTLNLIWLNPPRQRIAIYLTQPAGHDYSPDDLIKIFESMKVAN